MNEADFLPVLISECPVCELCDHGYLDASCEEMFYRTRNGTEDEGGLDCSALVVCDDCRQDWINGEMEVNIKRDPSV